MRFHISEFCHILFIVLHAIAVRKYFKVLDWKFLVPSLQFLRVFKAIFRGWHLVLPCLASARVVEFNSSIWSLDLPSQRLVL